MRIVSLLPSATEILFAVGAGADVVGVTFECDFPAEARTCRVVSNTAIPAGLAPAEIDAVVRARLAAGEDLYTLDEGALGELRPDLIVTQDLCAVCAVDIKEVDAALAHLGCHTEVLTLDPMRLSDVLSSVEQVGQATGHLTEAWHLTQQLRTRLAEVASKVDARDRPRVAMLEWTDPPFSSGHWVPDMVAAAGGLSVLGDAGTRSRETTWDDLAIAEPDVIVVAPCGYHLEDAARMAADLVDARLLPPRIPVWAVDADAAFVRPGPRLVDGVETLAEVLHPGAVDRGNVHARLISPGTRERGTIGSESSRPASR